MLSDLLDDAAWHGQIDVFRLLRNDGGRTSYNLSLGRFGVGQCGFGRV